MSPKWGYICFSLPCILYDNLIPYSQAHRARPSDHSAGQAPEPGRQPPVRHGKYIRRLILISKKSQERRQKAIERGTYSAASASPPIERNCAPPASGQKELYCPIIYHGPPPSDGAKKLIEPIEFHGPPASDGAKKLIEPIEFHERPNTPASAESPPSVPSCADNAAQQPPSNSYDFDLRQMIDYEPQAADAAREERNRSAMIAALSPRTLDGAPLAPPAADVIVKAQIPVFRPPVSPSPENLYNPIVFASEFENGNTIFKLNSLSSI